MYELKWSESEKKLARRVFEAALAAELAEVMANFKASGEAVVHSAHGVALSHRIVITEKLPHWTVAPLALPWKSC